eukprot:s2140_g16.t1
MAKHLAHGKHAAGTSSSSTSKKLKRLDELRRKTPYCTKAALEAILEDVASNGLPEVRTSKHMRLATDEVLAGCNQYGDLLLTSHVTLADGTNEPIKIINLLSFIYKAYLSGGQFYTALNEAFQNFGFTSMDHKFSLVIYSDECFPGNPLSAKAEKKLWVVYATWKELGYLHLSNQHMWFPLFVARSSFVSKVSGHMSQILNKILLSVFNGQQQALPDTVGVLLHGPDRKAVRFHFDLAIFCQDGASQKYTFGLKGDSGTRFCMKCTETALVPDGADPEEAAANFYKPKASLTLTTDASVLASFDRLANKYGSVPPHEFDMWQQATGWSFSSEGMLASRELRCRLAPVTNFMHDWMHGICQGTMPISMYLVLEALHEAGCKSWSALEEYFGFWVLPGAYRSCNYLWAKKRLEAHKKAGKIKAPASEILTIYPILQYFCKTIGAQASCQVACKAFLSQCHFLDLLVSLPHRGVSGCQLDQAAEICHQLFDDAGWTKYKIKKFHWMLHYGDSLETHEMLLSCFCQERKHKEILTAAKDVTNLSRYEASVYKEICAKQLHALQSPLPDSIALTSNCKPTAAILNLLHSFGLIPHGAECFTCASFHFSGGSVHKKDLVLLQASADEGLWGCAQILLIFAIDGHVQCMVSPFQLLEYRQDHAAAIWEPLDQHCIVDASQVLATLTYSKTKTGFTTLIPYHLQR